MIIAGGGVHYSGAVETLTDFAVRRGIPVVETVAGKADAGARPSQLRRTASASPDPQPPMPWPRMPTSCSQSGRVFRTSLPGRGRCSRTRTFDSSRSTLPAGTPTSRWPSRSSADAKVSLEATRCGDRRLPRHRTNGCRSRRIRSREWHGYLDSWKQREADGAPAYAQVIQVINEICATTTTTACLRPAAFPAS